MSTKKASNIKLGLLHFTSSFDRLIIVVGCICAALSGLSKPLQGIIMADISTAFIKYTKKALNSLESDPFDELYSAVSYTCFLWFLLASATFLLCFLQNYFLQLAGQNLSDRLQKEYLKALLNQDVAWFDTQKTGSLISEMIRNLDQVKEGTGPHIGSIIFTVIQLAGSFIVCMYYDWRLGQIATCLIPLIAVWAKIQQQKLEKNEKRSQTANREAGIVAEQVLGGIRTVMYFNSQEQETRRYEEYLEEIKITGNEQSSIEGMTSAVTNFLLFASCTLTIYYGSRFVFEGKIEGGVVVMIVIQIKRSLCQMNRVIAFGGKYTKAMVAASTLFEVIEREPEVEIDSMNSKFPPNIGNIVLKNVSFSYPSRPELLVLKEINFSIEQGQTVALVGASGCGKSTIVQLIQRLYDVPNGEIQISGEHINEIDLKHLRKTIGVVSQEPILFNTTIEENIRYGNSEVSEREIWVALRKSNAYDFVKAFPKGLKTLVGDRGAQLSGGQKQRIAIARALVRDPKILLLDEATSALDAESETVVQQALENASKGRTTIVVAHRLSTIRNASKIIAMKHGEIVEEGTHAELMAKEGLYFNLVNAQVFVDFDEKAKNRQLLQSRSISSEERNNFSIVPKQERKQTEKRGSNFWRILREIGPEWKILTIALATSIIKGIVSPAGFFSFTELTNIYSGPLDEILNRGYRTAFIYLGLAFFLSICQRIQTNLFASVANQLAYKLRLKSYRNLLRQDAAFYDRPDSTPGHLLTRLATDFDRIKPIINARMGNLFQEIFTDIVGCSLGIYYCWQIAIFAIPAFPLAVLCASWRNFILAKKMKENEKAQEKCSQLAMESVTNIKTVKSLNLQDVFHKKFCDHLGATRKFHTDMIISQSCSQGILISIHYYLYAALYFISLYLIRYFDVDAQLFIRSMYLIGWGSNSLATWLHYQPELLKAFIAADHIFQIIDEEPGIDSDSKDGEKIEVKGHIQLENVQFSYPEREEAIVLKGISLEIQPKKTIALVGASGCGKSTIVSLLERLYDPNSGKIKIDGNELTSMNLKHWRSNVSVVSQEPSLFDISIQQNITYGLEGDLDEEEIQEAARKANIHEFIMSLPKGYQTKVGDKGTQLSGGQKQRIAIARALVRKPRILILDEATSALDTESEKHVQLALDQAKTGRSCLVIAHRLSTILNSDLIIVFKDGQVAERGTHDQLIALKGVYYNLVQKQSSH